VLLYSRGSGSVASALKGSSCFGPQAQEPQGEAVGFTRDGAALLTASEGNGVPIYRSGPAPAPPASGKGTTTTVAPGGGGPSSRSTTLPGRVSSHTTAWATSSTASVRIGKWTSSSIGVATGPVVTTWTATPSRSTSLPRAAANTFSPAFDAE